MPGQPPHYRNDSRLRARVRVELLPDGKANSAASRTCQDDDD